MDIDVLVVGGGPAGLCSSLALSRLGVRCLLVERHPGTAIHPKALHLSSRTMEVFRTWGIAEDVRVPALPLSDHAMFLGGSMADPAFVRHPIWPDDPTVSAERSTLVSQEILEPVLRRLAERGTDELRGELRFSTRLTTLTDHGDSVTADLVDETDGRTTRVRARWVIGADGAASTVRTLAGIPFSGQDVHNSVNILFRADLTGLVRDRRSAFYYVQNDQFRGLLPVIDNAWTWRLHIVLSDGEAVEDYHDAARRTALIRAAIGLPDLDVDLGPVYGWVGGARVADRYRHGRLLLAGDAAHVNPPSGGLGMNMGIQDVHNLTWKVAAVVRGAAGEDLLDTYEQERRPVALRTVAEAVRNHEFESAPIRDDADRRRKHDRRRQNGLVLGQHYAVGAVVPDGTAVPEVADAYTDFVPSARPGHRAPHLWVELDGGRASLLDALRWDRATLLVAGPETAGWAAAVAGLPAGLSVKIVTVGQAPADAVPTDPAPGTAFEDLYGVGPGGAVLVRPDGIVALRVPSPDGNEPTLLRRALAALRLTHVTVGV